MLYFTLEGCANPTPMWEFWDEFGMQDTDMIGWWEPEVPVTVAATGADGPIHATAYVSKRKPQLPHHAPPVLPLSQRKISY